MEARLREGIKLFNRRRFFECHEVWEALYQESEPDDKAFIEGLIQLAAAFRLFCDFGETQGPVRMIHQALIRFEHYPPNFSEVRLGELSGKLEQWTQRAQQAATLPTTSSIPKIPIERAGLFS